jgi:hypothetical protein
MTDEGLRVLAQFTSLTSLNLYNCIKVTDKRVAALASLTALTSLNLYSCKNVTNEGARALQASSPALVSLGIEPPPSPPARRHYQGYAHELRSYYEGY